MALRYEGVRFSDGSIAVRRIAADPCDRATRTFEGMRELEEDIGSADVTWLHHPGKLDEHLVETQRRLAARTGAVMTRGVTVERPLAFISPLSPASGYEPEEEVDEP